MYSDILVPTDGSEEANRAAEHAIELGSNFDATVHALYAYEPAHTSLPSEAMRNEKIREECLEWGREITDEVASKAREHGLQGVPETTEGTPHEEITRYADENGVDAVVMGTAGQTGLRERLLGSVTEKTIRTSNIPVTVVQRKNGD